MSPLQQIIYTQMKEKGILIGCEKEIGGNGSRILLNTLMQLRKVCNHPYLFEHIEESMENHFSLNNLNQELQISRVAGKFELLDRILPKLKSSGHRVLIFTQMTSVLTILEQYLSYKGI